MDHRHQSGLQWQLGLWTATWPLLAAQTKATKNCRTSVDRVKHSPLVEITEAEIYAQRKKASVPTGHATGRSWRRWQICLCLNPQSKMLLRCKKSRTRRMQNELHGHRFLSEIVRPHTPEHRNMLKKLLLCITGLCHSQKDLWKPGGHTDLCSNSSSTVNNLGVPAALIPSDFLFSHSPSIHIACSHCIIMDFQLVTLQPWCFESSPRISLQANKLREKASRHPGFQLAGTSLNKALVLLHLGDLWGYHQRTCWRSTPTHALKTQMAHICLCLIRVNKDTRWTCATC